VRGEVERRETEKRGGTKEQKERVSEHLISFLGFLDRVGKLTGMTPNAMPTDAKDADAALKKMKSEKTESAERKTF
jgi:hypothetical protein